jgi:hypothetical protein
MSSTGNEAVFHGSFQTSRLIFPGGGKRLGEMAESGLIAMATKRSRAESDRRNKLDRIKCIWNQGWQ